MRVGVVDATPKDADDVEPRYGSDPSGLEPSLIVINGIPSIATAEYRAGEKLDIPSETKLEFTRKETLMIGREEF